ncbi:MAG: aminotransferase [Halopseudomonas sp.]
MSTPIDSKQIWKMDKDHFIHPYTDFSSFNKEGSQIITQAEGAYVSDSEGNRYLDGIAGLWCVNIGHGRREMADAMSEQVMQMGYYNPFGHCTNEPASRLAAKLAELAPGNLNHVFYGCGGSVANDTAIRLVHFYNNLRGKPQKKKIISRVDGYHGSTYLAASLTGIHATKNSFDCMDTLIDFVSAANMYRRPAGAEELSEEAYCDFLVDEFENRILQLGADNVAAFIAEPIMGAGGVLVAPEGYHQRMHAICKKYDMLFISDEVVTAFGRLGRMFASEDLYGFTPDIICIAKGLTSGYIPLGATLLSDDIYQVISQPQCEGGVLSHGFTYSGHPVACAAALKNIEIMERERVCEQVQELGPYFQKRLAELMDLPIVGDVRGSHFMAGIELVRNKTTKEGFSATDGSAMRVFKRCLNRGLVIRPIGNLIVVSPPLILSKEQCDQIVDTLQASIEETAAELKVAGLV